MSIKLLIIDDEQNIRETLRDYFEDIGWDVKLFACGEDALEHIAEESPEYIIVDGRLPGMTGIDFIRKATSIRSGIKYVIYTGLFDFSIGDDLRAIGITEKSIVMKPAIGFSALYNALDPLNKIKES